MIHLPHFGAAKVAAWIAGSAGVLAAALVADAKQGMSPLVAVALITSITSLLVAIITGGVSIYLQRQTGTKIDGMLEAKEKKEQELSETKETLAHAVGRREGVDDTEKKQNGV
jgi:hypothetical protein